MDLTTGRLLITLTVFYNGLLTCNGADYNGKLVGTLSDLSSHNIAGTVYAENDNTLRIIGFNYDGTAPDAFLWAGESGTPSSNGGFIIPNERGSTEKLGAYTNVDISVTLPTGKTVSSLAWLSVWCRQFAANFGALQFPANFVPPAPHSLGTLGFTPPVHRVYASDVIILNTKQLRVVDLEYDGAGPQGYFWVGTGGTPSNNNDDFAIPDENGATTRPGRYTGQTIVLTLPDGTDIFDIGHFGLWCIAFNQDFGHVDIPSMSNLNIPPAPLAAPPRMTFPNCKQLIEDELQVSWMVDGTDIIIRLSSTAAAGDYSAFGVSGSATGTSMIGGDVVVTFIDDQGDAQAVDYYLESQAQCSPREGQDGSGACPDTISSTQNGNNNVELIESYVENGITNIVYRRPLAAVDATYDKAIVTDASMYVIWAQGPINADGRVAYHQARRSPSSSNLQLNFGRASSICPPLGQAATVPPVDGWVIPGIEALEPTTFIVEMGLSGGSKGYEFITGRVGWGIAWFINGNLIPELTLKRNVTYTFLVSGGDDPAVSGNYHPFYITDDESGGYAQLTEEQKQGVTIYAGPEEGPLCQYMSTTDPDSYDTFDEFKNTLTKDCAPGDPGRLEWTVPSDSPDLLYYQCYTHRFLGWKIHVVDSGTETTTTPDDNASPEPQSPTTDSTGNATTITLSVFNIALFLFLYLIL